MSEIVVADNPAKRRYEAVVDGEVAGYVHYHRRDRDRTIVLIHTEVEEEYEGRGVGSRLASATLDDIRSQGLAVVPMCPFIRSHIARHPEYADLVAA